MKKKKISNVLFFIAVSFFISLISVGIQTAYAAGEENVIITITTNNEKAENLFNQLYKENYEIYKDGNRITAIYNQNKNLNSAISKDNTSSKVQPKSQYLIYGLVLAVVLSTVIVITRIFKSKGKNQEYFQEICSDYPIYYSFNNNSQCINLTQRLSDMQVQPLVYPCGYRAENNFSGYRTPEDNHYGYKHYSKYNEQDQFNLIRQKPRD